MTIAEQKAAQRKAGIAARRALSDVGRASANAALCARIAGLDCFRTAQNILLYAAFGGEADLSALAGQAAAQGKTLANKLVRAGRAMNAAVYFVTQNAADLADESLKNNIGLKFAFRSTDIVEIKKTLEFFGLDPEDEGNQKRLRNLENGQCLMQDLYGHVGVVQFHPVFADFLHGFDTKPPMKAGVAV